MLQVVDGCGMAKPSKSRTGDSRVSAVYVASSDDWGAMISYHRRRARLSQLELDWLTGLPDGYTSKVEGGRAYPTGLALSLYLTALGLVLVPSPARAGSMPPRLRNPPGEQLPLPLDLPHRRDHVAASRRIKAMRPPSQPYKGK